MVFQGLSRALSRTPNVSDALSYATRDADFSVVEGLNAPLLSALLEERISRGEPPVVLAVTATNREAERLAAALSSLMPHAELCDFPAWETLPHERLSPSPEIVGRRFDALRRVRDWDGNTPLVMITSVRGVLQPIADNLGDVEPISLNIGSRGNDLAAISAQLVDLAYVRVDMVTRRGEFAVRGGILDVFPPVADHPVRLDFFGDEVDSIRAFSVADQRSLDGDIPSIQLPPSRELLLTAAVRQRAREMEHEFPGINQMLAKIAEGIAVEGMESLTPALVNRLVPITTYLPAGAAIALLSPERIATRAINLTETNREFLDAAWNAASAGAQSPIDLSAGDFLTVSELRSQYSGGPWWTFSAFQHGPDASEPLPEELDLDEILAIRIAAKAVPTFAGNVDGAVDHVQALLMQDWTVVIAAEGHGLVERAAQVLAERSLAGRMVAELPLELEPGVAYLVQASVEAGFELEDAKLAVISEAEFYGRAAGYDARAPRKLASRRKNVVDPLKLEAGDIVVHETHGIGKFLELVQREVSSGGRNAVKTMREYLVIEYAPSKRGYPGDKLYVPTDQLDQLTRYVGGEAPALSKMGGSDWGQAKSKARKAVRDIAVELVKLYSARMASKGFSFSPDTPWQRELEEAFPYVETTDQLTTIDEVKADMERPIPMDRLISGDVGFGKTEIAVRAAFKAVQDGKQVAILVPTTLLVKQHFETFQERFAGFPVHLRALSRFQTDKEAKETLAGMTDGTVDVVIGTHRLLAQGVTFKDLGLVIIDEEQRFGVEHKDALKKLKTNVDILAMSATPIPRTLEMAVTGIREMSTLATPPEDRHPILTFVGPFSEKQAAAAIRREILREGQVFFVHNRVSSINRVAAQIAELVPEARVGVAHGQLTEHQLEQVIIDFWERKFDVLVSTTIIETGLDIANANTLIVDRADKYGLSQLHQLRGRVGRGRERAYAYLFYDETTPLSETAHDRLGALAANNELGSGIQIALKDLEIRGAGNLLGGEQSGHIAGVGFDLYLRMIGEAVSAFRGDVAEGQTELRLELPVDARIPDDYVDSERLRLEAYQKLSVASGPISRDEQIGLVLEELTDRYGEPPAEVHNLIAVSRLRRRAHQSSLSEVVVMGSNLRITPADLPDSIQVRLARMYPGAKYVPAARVISVPLPENADLITWTATLLDAIFPLPAKVEEASASSDSAERE
ncbi:transcription-repair coupling factor (superfamily II helicase) [Aurantimicrobium minutum]|uniref:transcription-repair coupling factor n=1 Tax=Aurantimicrobium minutum TaxID=708131 RepID=UPI002476CA9D|nr:transcription-repair coupling factor [Aurantimicrobium minutum]MDH6532507.1 transcription-repair coupling factor (superfamily II helicase) [Aurantimicrobium minutum]